MKIALISHLYPTKLFPHQGKFIQDQFELLNEDSGNEVDLIVPTPYTIPFTGRWKASKSELLCYPDQSFRVRYLSFPKRRFPGIIQRSLSKQTLSFLRKKQYDIVHVHWAYPDGLVLPDLKKSGFKTVLTIHGSDWYQTKDTPVLSDLIEESFRASDRVLYSGPKLKQDIEKRFPELRLKSDIIYNMVDTDVYKPASEAEKISLRKKLNWDNSKTHVLTVGSLRSEKGVDMLVDTITGNPALSDICFHIIGNSENTEYSQKVLKGIEENPFNNVELIPAVSPKELIKYYQAADFYILPSRREGFNVSILEAVSCGLPLVCTKVGGNSEVIEKGTGIITESFKKEGAIMILKMSQTYNDYTPKKLNTLIEDSYGKQAFLKRLNTNYKLVLNS
ncbi:MAG: glycosyltransferase [Balneola sp.]|jgi:teichuronic acid biosynthesis glycosyltransferase TuaC